MAGIDTIDKLDAPPPSSGQGSGDVPRDPTLTGAGDDFYDFDRGEIEYRLAAGNRFPDVAHNLGGRAVGPPVYGPAPETRYPPFPRFTNGG